MASHSAAVWRAVLVAFLLVTVTYGFVVNNDPVQVHSIIPPILKNYWMSGMEYWAFGRNSVVTDNYVQLTDLAPDSEGYLWNRHESVMEDFVLNVTVQMTSRDGRWFADGSGSGFAVWYTNTKKFNAQLDSSFFGGEKVFDGIGVVLTHDNELSLILNDGTKSLDSKDIRTIRQGYCTVSAFGSLHITVSIIYDKERLKIQYAMHPNEEPVPSDYLDMVLCIDSIVPDLRKSHHFGVTAVNSEASMAMHTVHSVILQPLYFTKAHAKENEAAALPRFKE